MLCNSVKNSTIAHKTSIEIATIIGMSTFYQAIFKNRTSCITASRSRPIQQNTSLVCTAKSTTTTRSIIVKRQITILQRKSNHNRISINPTISIRVNRNTSPRSPRSLNYRIYHTRCALDGNCFICRGYRRIRSRRNKNRVTSQRRINRRLNRPFGGRCTCTGIGIRARQTIHVPSCRQRHHRHQHHRHHEFFHHRHFTSSPAPIVRTLTPSAQKRRVACLLRHSTARHELRI